MRIIAPFQYYGAKNRLAPWITGFLTPHRVYVEPFAGSAAALFAKPASTLEIINDLDDDVVTFFRMLRDHSSELIEALALTPYSRCEYRRSCLDGPPESEIERARRFFIRANMGFNGRTTRLAGYSSSARAADGSLRRAPHSRFANKVDRLHAVAERLRRVEIESTDAAALIGRWDAPDVSLYCDPPYLADTRRKLGTYGATDFDSPQWHGNMLRQLNEFRGQVLLSGYDNDLYRSTLGDGWTAHNRAVTACTSCTSDNDSRRVETLWVKERCAS